MPAGWLKQQESTKLAEQRAQFDLQVSVDELPARPEGIQPHAILQAQIGFGMEQGRVIADLTLRGPISLICQRCLGPMVWQVDAASRVALLDQDADVDGLPAELEVFITHEGRVSLPELIAEELLLATPSAPRHADAAQCAASAQPQSAETQRPFADLRALLDGR